jgi:beta-galactosidase
MSNLKLAVCYYPEQWDSKSWESEIKKMADLGLIYVRVAEFSWSLLEPSEKKYNFGWLEQVLDLLHKNNLQAIVGTPTTAPPRWIIDKYPDILPWDKWKNPKQFGSRRHYRFSDKNYLGLCKEIVEKMARYFCQHPAIVGWQTDNEYACHDTVYSYSPADDIAFQEWLKEKYQTIEKLNKAWGNCFWGMHYNHFSQIEIPINTITSSNPSHFLDYRRFASRAVIRFNEAQVTILRKICPHHWITHNLMAFIEDFDHFELCKTMDMATWDSYPLGFLSQFSFFSDKEKEIYQNTGHPDVAAFHHDLYRACGKERFGVMEQQPGAVNWASYNPKPLENMVRFWSLEALAHGAEFVSYFRWRQVPFAQEQMHTALNLVNGEAAQGYIEVQSLAKELKEMKQLKNKPAEVAIFFDYQSIWFYQASIQGTNVSYLLWVFQIYEAIRSLGLNIDFVSSFEDLKESHKICFVPSLVFVSQKEYDLCKKYSGMILWGTGSGSKTEDFHIPLDLPPLRIKDLLKIEITLSQTMKNSCSGTGCFGDFTAVNLREKIRSPLDALSKFDDGDGLLFQNEKHFYLAAHLDKKSLQALVAYLLEKAQIKHQKLPEGVRVRQTEEKDFYFNFSPNPFQIEGKNLKQGELTYIEK